MNSQFAVLSVLGFRPSPDGNLKAAGYGMRMEFSSWFDERPLQLFLRRVELAPSLCAKAQRFPAEVFQSKERDVVDEIMIIVLLTL